MLDEVTVAMMNINPVPVVTVTSSAEGITSTVFTFGSASYDPDGYIRSCDWDFGDGSSGNGNMTSHNFSQAGTYDVVAHLLDSDGGTANYSIKINITRIAENNSPKIDKFTPVSLNISVKVGSSVKFEVIASDKDGDRLHFTWYFDNVLYSSDQNTTVKFAKKGIHNVRVDVSDGIDHIDNEWTVQASESNKSGGFIPASSTAMVVLAFVTALMLDARIGRIRSPIKPNRE